MACVWIFLLICFSASSFAVINAQAPRTAVTTEQSRLGEPMPRPTTKQPEPNDLLLRQNNEYATCGAFVDGNPMECSGGRFCNTDNPYSVIACYDRAETSPRYSPYSCSYHTWCSNSGTNVRFTNKPDGEGGYVGTRYCGDSTAPSCVPVFFTDIDYYYYGCAATFPDDPWYATLSPEGDIDDDRTTTTTKTEPAVDIESGFSSNTRTSESTTGTGSSPTPTDDPSPPDETSSTGAIVGGVAGGVAAIAAAAGAWFLLRRRNKKDQEKPNESSFIVLGSNLQPSSSRMENAKNQVPGADGTKSEPFAFLNTTTEGPTNSLDQPRGTPPMPPMPVPSPSPDMAPAYQPYNPSYASGVTLAAGSFNLGQPVLTPQSSFHRPSHYTSHGSLMPTVSEVHGHSASSSRDSTPTRPGPGSQGGSRFSELDSFHMSSQSGPVPEWNTPKQELP